MSEPLAALVRPYLLAARPSGCRAAAVAACVSALAGPPIDARLERLLLDAHVLIRDHEFVRLMEDLPESHPATHRPLSSLLRGLLDGTTASGLLVLAAERIDRTCVSPSLLDAARDAILCVLGPRHRGLPPSPSVLDAATAGLLYRDAAGALADLLERQGGDTGLAACEHLRYGPTHAGGRCRWRTHCWVHDWLTSEVLRLD